MDPFIQRENIKHYRELLKTAKDEAERQKILKLLTKEQQKGNGASDRIKRIRPPQLAASFISTLSFDVAYWHIADNAVAPAFCPTIGSKRTKFGFSPGTVCLLNDPKANIVGLPRVITCGPTCAALETSEGATS